MDETGHARKRLFTMRVNGIYYHPTIKSPNKKEGKHLSAQVVLQAWVVSTKILQRSSCLLISLLKTCNDVVDETTVMRTII